MSTPQDNRRALTLAARFAGKWEAGTIVDPVSGLFQYDAENSLRLAGALDKAEHEKNTFLQNWREGHGRKKAEQKWRKELAAARKVAAIHGHMSHLRSSLCATEAEIKQRVLAYLDALGSRVNREIPLPEWAPEWQEIAATGRAYIGTDGATAQSLTEAIAAADNKTPEELVVGSGTRAGRVLGEKPKDAIRNAIEILGTQANDAGCARDIGKGGLEPLISAQRHIYTLSLQLQAHCARAEEISENYREECFQAVLERVRNLDLTSVQSGDVSTTRTIGEEIEVVFQEAMNERQRASVAMALLNKIGLEPISCTTKEASTYSRWVVSADASVRGPNIAETGRGLEIVSPVLTGRQGIQEYLTVLSALKNIGAGANSTCGAHLHVGAEDFIGNESAQAALIRNYAMNEPVIDSFVSNERREGDRGGSRLTAPTLRHEEEMARLDALLATKDSTTAAARSGCASKRARVNLGPIDTRGAIEFRQLGGRDCLDERKAVSWLLAMHEMVDRASRRPDEILRLEIDPGGLLRRKTPETTMGEGTAAKRNIRKAKDLGKPIPKPARGRNSGK